MTYNKRMSLGERKIVGGVTDEVRELQNEAVSALFNKINILNEVTFKAPTGSGKTFMMADLMNRVLADKSVIFIVSTLSKGGLATQNYQKFLEYSRTKFTRLAPYLINTNCTTEERLTISADYNVYVLPRDLVKKTGRLQAGALKDFLNTMTGKTSLFDGEKTVKLTKKIFVIKDECHDATKNLDSLKEEYFSKVINFSATPNLKKGQIPDVEINERQATDAALIKKLEWGEDGDTLDKALTEFESTRHAFHELGIRNAFIIQISNKDLAQKQFDDIVTPALKNHPDLKWMYIVDKLKDCKTNDELEKKGVPRAKWKEYLKGPASSIDVIIFKMVITEGYDAPRASMLYQIRDAKSEILKEQVLGRIRRNPCLLGFESLSEEEKTLVTSAKAWGKRPGGGTVINLTLKSGAQGKVKVKTTKLLPLTQKKDFDLGAFLENKPLEYNTEQSFFKLAQKVEAAPSDVKTMIYNWAGGDINKWYKAAFNLEKIIAYNNEYILDYEKSMKLGEECALPMKTYSISEGNYTLITSWVWKKTREDAEGEKKEFSFDSAAERLWAEKLKDLASSVVKTEEDFLKEEVSLWGKNFLPNSEVKFEYYNFGLHNSYPDFVLVDKFDRVHIFEVKSFEARGDIGIDESTYKEKVDCLKEAYKAASKLTKQFFYIPIRQYDKWTIYAFKDGKETKMTTDEFEADIKKMN